LVDQDADLARAGNDAAVDDLVAQHPEPPPACLAHRSGWVDGGVRMELEGDYR